MSKVIPLAGTKKQLSAIIKDVEDKEEREAIARAKAQVRKGKTVSLGLIKKKYDLS